MIIIKEFKVSIKARFCSLGKLLDLTLPRTYRIQMLRTVDSLLSRWDIAAMSEIHIASKRLVFLLCKKEGVLLQCIDTLSLIHHLDTFTPHIHMTCSESERPIVLFQFWGERYTIFSQCTRQGLSNNSFSIRICLRLKVVNGESCYGQHRTEYC